MSNHETAEVTVIPDCDLCEAQHMDITPAYADAQLPTFGSWAYVCLHHFTQYGCSLGLGHGQELVATTVRQPNQREEEPDE